MQLTRVRTCVAWVAAGLAASASMYVQAALIEPPSEFMFKSQHSIVAGEIVRKDADGAVELQVSETLHGTDAPSTLELHTSPQWLAGFDAGDKVLAAYSSYRRSATRPKTLELRRGGPVIIVSAGIEPALFHDTASARAMFFRRPDAMRVPDRAWLDNLLAGLASTDPQTQNFDAAELVLREPLHAFLIPADHAVLARFANNAAGHPSARASLLTAAAARPERFGAGWPADAALRIIASTPVPRVEAELDFVPNLVRIAFELLEKSGSRVPVASAQRWLPSPQAGLAEAALLAIRRTEPKREREVAERALARTDLTPASREFLRDHLRRLAIMQESLDTAAAVDEDKG